MIYLTEYDPQTRQPLSPSQPLPCDGLDAVPGLMGPADSTRPGMLLYYGPPAFCVTRFPLCIDVQGNSGDTNGDITQTQD